MIKSIHLTVVAVELCHAGSAAQVVAQEVGKISETCDSITYVVDLSEQPKVGDKLDIDIYLVEEES